MSSRRDLLRRIAPAILLVGGLAIGMKLCEASQKLTDVTIVYRLGDLLAAEVTELSAKVGDDADFRTSLIAAEVKHKTRLPPGDHAVVVTLQRREGTPSRITRHITVTRGATIYVDLG